MIRLALSGPPDVSAEVEQIAMRLQAVEVLSLGDESTAELLASRVGEFDALVLHDSSLNRKSLQALVSAGKHVLLVDPGDESAAHAARAAREFQQAGIRLSVARSERYRPAIQTIRDSLLADQLGRPGLVRIHRWCSSSADTAPEASAAIRDIDLACWLFGSVPEVVFATRSHPDGPGNLTTHLGFPDGGMALLDVSTALPDGGDYFSLSVIGARGSAIADDHRNQQLVFGDGAPMSVRTGHAPLHRLALLQDFVDSITERTQPLVTLDSIETVETVVAAIRESLTSRQSVQLGGAVA